MFCANCLCFFPFYGNLLVQWCVLCKGALEDFHHILWSCQFAWEIWDPFFVLLWGVFNLQQELSGDGGVGVIVPLSG